MTEHYSEAIDELRQIAREYRERAQGVCYGFFQGGDPRNFSPDPEASDPVEQEAHAAACARWEKGDTSPVPMPQCLRGDPKVVGFGLGVNSYEDEECLDTAERLERILDRLERAE